jgi:uncharacterized protein
MAAAPVEPISPVAPALPTRVILSQRWSRASFLHWRVEPSVVAPLLPPGTRPDEFDGSTWVGLIGFHMSEFAIRPGPPLPYVGTFPEINVRLYSVDDEGRRGVVFRSLEATRVLTVLGARLGLNVPYEWARMSMTETPDGALDYRSRRITGTHPSTHFVVRPGAAIPQPDPLADFLTSRWAMHTRVRGATRYVPNEHEPWPLREAELLTLDDQLIAAAGLPGVASRHPESVLYSAGVRTAFGMPLPHVP